MNKRYLTDEVGVILAIFTYDQDGLYLAMKQGKQLAKAFPDSEIYLHEVFTTGKLEVGMCSSMKGPLTRIE